MRMGFLDDVQTQLGQGTGFLGDLGASLSHGTEAAGRAATSAKLKVQLADAQRRRKDLLTQLGDTLYDATKDLPEFRAGREQIYDGIAEVDAEMAGYEQQSRELEAAAPGVGFGAGYVPAEPVDSYGSVGSAYEGSYAAEAVEATGTVCPHCGAPVEEGDLFCINCGKKIEVAPVAAEPIAAPIEAAANEKTCPRCGEPMDEDDVFCSNCGFSFFGAGDSGQVGQEIEEEPAISEPEATGWEDNASPEPEPEPEPTLVAKPVSAPVPPTPSDAGLTCPSCGAPRKPTDKFCMKCGAKLETPSPSPDLTCPSCGAPRKPTDKFCMKCGAKLH